MKKIGTLDNNFFEKMTNFTFIFLFNLIFNVNILIDLKQQQTNI
jgi:hypothetical protein